MNCLNCDAILTGKWNVKFCSHKCYLLHKQKKSLIKKESTCKFCGKSFHLKRSEQIFCSTLCASKYRAMTIGVWNKNKNHPKYKEYIQLMRNKQGPKNPNFKFGWDWLRAKIRREEKTDSCEICGNHKNIELHHIDFNKNNNVRTNIAIICKSCHTKIHNKIKNIKKVSR